MIQSFKPYTCVMHFLIYNKLFNVHYQTVLLNVLIVFICYHTRRTVYMFVLLCHR